MPIQKPTKAQGGAVAALIALCGYAVASGSINDIRTDEGRRYHAYHDVGAIVSICDGDTHNARMGMVQTDAQCDARTAQNLLATAGPVLRCAPTLRQVGHENQLRASLRFTYNVGAGAFCNGWFRNRQPVSTLFRSEQWTAACGEMLRYDMVRGRHIKGLMNRRKHEYAMCMRGLP